MLSRTHLRSSGPWFCSNFLQVHFIAMLGLGLICPVVCSSAQDENATRSTISERKSKTRKIETGARNSRKAQPPIREASVTIKVDPADSNVYIDGQQFDTNNSVTGLRLSGLSPGPHTVTVRHGPIFEEKEQIISLKPGENEPINIRLERLVGNLDVVPSVEDSQISIENIEGNQRVPMGTYSGRVNGLALPPGSYDVTIAKSGYRSSTRRITIKPGESIFLEPQVVPLPTPTPTPALTRAVSNIPSRSVVDLVGKYFIVQLHGASGDIARRVGTMNVVLAEQGHTVTGALPGVPCQVRFVQLENVAEGSLVEAPGPSNEWAKITVRVRPKNSKRPVAFAINWTTLDGMSPPVTNLTEAAFVEAVAIQKVKPEYSASARGSNVSGTVDVAIVIDAQGNVVSAKALDGPFVFRSPAENAARKWKFQPATRNGQPVESTQTLRFVFER